jgi:hypothetical protein
MNADDVVLPKLSLSRVASASSVYLRSCVQVQQSSSCQDGALEIVTPPFRVAWGISISKLDVIGAKSALSGVD